MANHDDAELTTFDDYLSDDDLLGSVFRHLYLIGAAAAAGKKDRRHAEMYFEGINDLVEGILDVLGPVRALCLARQPEAARAATRQVVGDSQAEAMYKAVEERDATSQKGGA
jgi:hypothetical protein